LERARSIATRAGLGKPRKRPVRPRRGCGSAPRCSRCGCRRASAAVR